MSIKSNFVFVVFNDPVVVGVIGFLSSVLDRARRNSPPHLTIQGPFEEKATLEDIASIKRRLMGDVFFIGNPGLFVTQRGAALFLRAESENLSKVWNKPDFPTSVYGFNPHVTIYDGPDLARAERAYEHLKRNRVELLCRDFDVVQYVPKQLDLFAAKATGGDENAISILMARGKLNSSFRASYMAAVNGDE